MANEFARMLNIVFNGIVLFVTYHLLLFVIDNLAPHYIIAIVILQLAIACYSFVASLRRAVIY